MSGLVKNAELYRWHQRFAGAAFWAPTMVLFLVDEFGLAGALRMQAIYYAAVVLLEVPSGWFSDRVGRVPTLRVVAVAWIGAHGLFVLGGFAAVVIGQVLLAVGYAFLSGTDVTFHLESLDADGRSDEFEEREASSRRGLLYVAAATALVGGALAAVDLRLPFVASSAAAVGQLVVAFRFREVGSRPVARPRFVSDLRATAGRLKDPLLGWVGLYMLGQVVAVHVIAEFTAPYLTEVFSERPGATAWAALTTGGVTAVVAVVAALSLRGLVPWSRRFGLGAVLVGIGLLPVVVVTAMALVATVWVLPLLSVRRVQAATASVLVPSLVASRVPPNQRATLLSILSLAGRLSYTGVLVGIATVAGDDLGQSLWLGTGIVVVLWLLMLAFQRRVSNFPRQPGHDHWHGHDAIEHDHTHIHGDGHHDHHHDPAVVAAHSHPHRHEPVEHQHPHTADVHHRHDHR